MYGRSLGNWKLAIHIREVKFRHKKLNHIPNVFSKLFGIKTLVLENLLRKIYENVETSGDSRRGASHLDCGEQGRGAVC